MTCTASSHDSTSSHKLLHCTPHGSTSTLWHMAGAPLQVAAERLAVLARSAEAIDIATRVPLEKRTSLAGLDCR